MFHLTKALFLSLCVVASVKHEARVSRMVSLQLAAVLAVLKMCFIRLMRVEESRAAL